MIAHTVAALALLVGPALVPSLALLGARPMTVFVTPLVGAILAAVAAEFGGRSRRDDPHLVRDPRGGGQRGRAASL